MPRVLLGVLFATLAVITQRDHDKPGGGKSEPCKANEEPRKLEQEFVASVWIFSMPLGKTSAITPSQGSKGFVAVR
jgi:hypothetical protein